MDKEKIQEKIKELEAAMSQADFWNDKNKAQEVIKKIVELKAQKEGLGKYDKGNAIITIISGAGGDDAEDFSAMLFAMYEKYAKKKKWNMYLIHEHKNDHNGYKNITVEVSGVGSYGMLK